VYIGLKNVAYSRARIRLSLETSDCNEDDDDDDDDDDDVFSLFLDASVDDCKATLNFELVNEGVVVKACVGNMIKMWDSVAAKTVENFMVAI